MLERFGGCACPDHADAHHVMKSIIQRFWAFPCLPAQAPRRSPQGVWVATGGRTRAPTRAPTSCVSHGKLRTVRAGQAYKQLPQDAQLGSTGLLKSVPSAAAPPGGGGRRPGA